VILTFTAGGKMEIVSWLLSYGRHAEILEPPGLRDEMRRNAHDMAILYGE
jgi:proteasome accessory factor B